MATWLSPDENSSKSLAWLVEEFLPSSASADQGNEGQDHIEKKEDVDDMEHQDHLLDAEPGAAASSSSGNGSVGFGAAEMVEACTQYAGDLLYTPTFWHHATVNLAETVAVAWRENHHGPMVYRFLQVRSTYISNAFLPACLSVNITQ